MRRRPKPRTGTPIPPELLTYDPEDWPLGCHPECAYWRARDEFRAAHPHTHIPHALDGPDTPFHAEDV